MKIVIVSDTPINSMLMESYLENLTDCEAISFTEPVPGLAWCIENNPDLIIVDYLMPGLSGIEFIERLRAAPNRIDNPVLMITANSDRKVRYAALQAGANDFLTKPVDRDEFQPRIKNLLALREALQQNKDRATFLSAEVAKATELIYLRECETVLRLAKAAEFRNPATGAHVLRMAAYAQLIAHNLGSDPTWAKDIYHAAPMHDVGKLGIPEHILLKPGNLSNEEFTITKRHPIIGYHILRDSSSPVMQLAANIALNHHERYDGGGYPRGIKGEDIPLEARIVAIADVFDALTSNRPYRTRWALDKATDHIRNNSGIQFDPKCVEAFCLNFDAIEEVHRKFIDEEAATSDWLML